MADEFADKIPFSKVSVGLRKDVRGLLIGFDVLQQVFSLLKGFRHPGDADAMGSTQGTHGRIPSGLHNRDHGFIVFQETDSKSFVENEFPQTQCRDSNRPEGRVRSHNLGFRRAVTDTRLTLTKARDREEERENEKQLFPGE